MRPGPPATVRCWPGASHLNLESLLRVPDLGDLTGTGVPLGDASSTVERTCLSLGQDTGAVHSLEQLPGTTIICGDAFELFYCFWEVEAVLLT